MGDLGDEPLLDLAQRPLWDRPMTWSSQAYLDEGHGQRKREMKDDPTPSGGDGDSSEERLFGEAAQVLVPALLLELTDLHLDAYLQGAGERSRHAVGQDTEGRLEQSQPSPFERVSALKVVGEYLPFRTGLRHLCHKGSRVDLWLAGMPSWQAYLSSA